MQLSLHINSSPCSDQAANYYQICHSVSNSKSEITSTEFQSKIIYDSCIFSSFLLNSHPIEQKPTKSSKTQSFFVDIEVWFLVMDCLPRCTLLESMWSPQYIVPRPTLEICHSLGSSQIFAYLGGIQGGSGSFQRGPALLVWKFFFISYLHKSKRSSSPPYFSYFAYAFSAKYITPP